MKIIIAGGGRTGLTLSNLLGQEHEITIVEKDEKRAEQIASQTHALVVHGDGTDISLLKEAGLAEADAVVSTVDDQTNLMVCQIARSEDISKIITLVSNPENEELFAKLGINKIVSVVGTNATAIRQLLQQVGDERIIAQLGDGEMQIIEMPVAEKSPLIGQDATIKNATLAAIYRTGELILPHEGVTLEKGDVLLVVVKTVDLPKITDLISGK